MAALEHRRASEQLRLRTLKSPINGVVVERLMHPGELADTGDIRKPILKIADITMLYVEAVLPVEAFGIVKTGHTAEVIPEAPVGGRFEAKVAVVDRVFDAASGTFGVRLALANPKMTLAAGVKCKVAFQKMPDSVTAIEKKAKR